METEYLWVAAWIFLLIITAITVVIIGICSWCIMVRIPKDFRYDSRPSLPLLFIKGMCISGFRRQGYSSAPSESRARTGSSAVARVRARACRVDSKTLKQYLDVCGYDEEDAEKALPPCYLETLFMPLIISLVTSEEFKLSPLGLIHVGQTLRQECDMKHLLVEAFDMECSAEEYRQIAKGVEVDIAQKVYDGRDICVWEGIMTVLSRNKDTRQRRQERRDVSQTQNDSKKTAVDVYVQVPGDMGVRYARASGDWNPHHLWPWSAKLLGYRNPIAHGMWTVAKSLELLVKTGSFELSPPFEVKVNFKRPLFLPGSATFSFTPQPDEDCCGIQICDSKSGAPHLVGTIKRKK